MRTVTGKHASSQQVTPVIGPIPASHNKTASQPAARTSRFLRGLQTEMSCDVVDLPHEGRHFMPGEENRGSIQVES